MRRGVIAFLLFVLAACGGNGQEKKATAPCSPSGTDLSISIQNIKFTKDCLAAPAGEAFTITLDNKDSDTHNLAIYIDENADPETRLFLGEIFGGPKVTTYNVPAQDAGTYYFRCDVHPETNGTFVVS